MELEKYNYELTYRHGMNSISADTYLQVHCDAILNKNYDILDRILLSMYDKFDLLC